MATSVRLIRRYVWLIDTIRRAGRITLQDINRKWSRELSLRNDHEDEIPERTFHRHREAIEDLFGIEIRCDRTTGNTYYIANEEILERPTFTSWLFNGLALDNILGNDEETAKRIYFEETPGGNQYLSPIIEAISKKRKIKLEYKSFNKNEVSERIVEPYGLKQSGRRWYLVCHYDNFEDLSVFALDRILSLKITNETFQMDPEYDIHTYFDEVMGVNLDGDYTCERIVVRIYGHQRNYIDTLPLHKSQKRIARTKEYSDYEFYLRPEYEFRNAILGMGSNAEVLSPAELREDFLFEARRMLQRYESN